MLSAATVTAETADTSVVGSFPTPVEAIQLANQVVQYAGAATPSPDLMPNTNGAPQSLIWLVQACRCLQGWQGWGRLLSLWGLLMWYRAMVNRIAYLR